jgi:hypothetical protein
MAASKRALWVGLALVAICWPLNWLLPGVRTSYLFFPLWLGYILTVDGLTLRRSGTSLLTRSRADFVRLFIISAPAWQLFEWINHRTRNWEYLGSNHFGPVSYFLISTLCFSTVVPAVLETEELVQTFRWVSALPRRRSFLLTRNGAAVWFLTGCLMLALALSWPRIFYPLVWGGIFLIVDPINHWSGRPSLLAQVAAGNWKPAVSLALGALICGWFWEMWNYYSYPKWIYHTPGVDFCHIFEMPALGFLGYIPFAWEVFALANLPWPKPLRIAEKTNFAVDKTTVIL